MKILPIHKAIVDNYIANGGNGKQAYLSVRPNAKPNTAAVKACEILKREEVKHYLHQQQNKVSTDSIASREYLIKQAHEIGQEAREAKAYVPALNSVELKAKLNGVLDKDSDSTADYTKIMQTLIIQGDININTPNENIIEVMDSK